MADLGSVDAIDPSLWPEDTVEYRLHLLPSSLGAGGSSTGDLAQLAVECNFACKRLSGNHVWHYAGFHLRPDSSSGSITCLVGRTCFGDGIHDEWFIVHILLALSKEYPDFVISVMDGDGQFLCIEAAHCLESWMQPEEMTNRVFLHKGCVHIIPKPHSPAEIGLYPVTTPPLEEAVRLVLEEGLDTVASQRVQDCINKRLASSRSVTVLHRANCLLPSLAAHALSCDPQLVSAACHALSDRSPADMVACSKMAVFSPTKHAMVVSRVVFTRLLYAQLLRLQFSGPKKAGFKQTGPDSAKFKECNLGMKLACGLEILYQRARRSGCLGTPETAEDNSKWPPFLLRLQEHGYFSSELQGSERYQEKLASAREYFLKQRTCREESGGGINQDLEDPLESAGKRVVEIVESCKDVSLSEEELTSVLPSDDDSWLNVSEKELDHMLQQAAPPLSAGSSHHCSEKPHPPADSASSSLSHSNSADLHSMVYGMKSFVEKESSHAGAEFPWSNDSNAAVDFDPDSCLEKIMSMLREPASNLQDSRGETEISDEDLESLSDGDFSDEMEGQGEELRELMELMDEQLAGTTIEKSFQKEDAEEGQSDVPEATQTGVSSDTTQPVDVNFNLVKNLLDSYSSQGGMAGPASNILHSLGIKIPDKSS